LRVVLGSRGLVLGCRNKVVIAETLVILLLLLLEPRGPLVVVYDLFPLPLRGVQGHHDCFLAVHMVGCNVKELPSSSGSPAP
jgi:hypothetical protein